MGKEKILKGIKFELKPKNAQKSQLNQWIGSARYVYNYMLEKSSSDFKSGVKNSANKYEMIKHLPKLKNEEEKEFLKEVPSQVLQQSIMNLYDSYKRFFSKQSSYPKFKKKFRKNGIRFPYDPKGTKIRKTSRRTGKIKIPKMDKELTFRMSQEFPGKIKSYTISFDGYKYYISFLCEIDIDYVIEKEETKIQTYNEAQSYIKNFSLVGIDRGINKTLMLSSGEVYNLPIGKIKKIENKIKIQQRKMSYKKGNRKGEEKSNNFKKQKRKINKLNKQIANIRHDWMHKVSNDIIKNHDVIILEKLKIKNMTKSSKGTIENPGKKVKQKSGLNKSSLRQGWHKLFSFLEYKTNWNNQLVLYVDPKNTSRTCSNCDHVDKDSRDKENFSCTSCNFKIDADLNASINIRARGRRVHALWAWDEIENFSTSSQASTYRNPGVKIEDQSLTKQPISLKS